MDERLRWASAVEQRRLLDAGELSADELRQSCIDVIDHLDPMLGAVVAPLFDRPGDGVPMLLKDAGQEVAATPHWVGVAALRDAGARSSSTTALAAAFEMAGMSIIGKSACPQLSLGVTTEPSGFTPTRNPWDPSRSAGGSSGGSAAAVAAGMVAVAHGSDATGSLRCPAALCGLVTLVPTAGSIEGVPPAGQLTHSAWREFVLTRHTEDLALMFTALTGTSPSGDSPSLRIGLLDHDPELGLPVDPACAEAVTVTGRLFETLGHHVETAWPATLSSFWTPLASSIAIVADATRPAMIDWVAKRLGRPPRPGELDEQVFVAADRARHRPAETVATADEKLRLPASRIEPWFTDHDLLVTPATFQPAWPLNGHPDFAEIGSLLAPFSLSGHPAVTAPVYRTDHGLPVGVQLVARHHADTVLLDVLGQLEQVVGWTTRHPTPHSSKAPKDG